MSVRVEKVLENLYLLRVDDRETRFFEALWEIPEGITYNAYLLLGEEKTVLFDTWKKQYSELFIETLKEITDIREIGYLVAHHAEPDHSGSLPALVRHNSKLKVLGHPLAKGMLESFYHTKLNFQPVKDGDTLDIGGKSLKFIYTPWLHWPETIMTYIEEDRALLSCDAFGSYSIPSATFDDQEENIEKYLDFAKKYIVTVIGHYRKFIPQNVKKLNSLGIKPKIIAPSHGLIFRTKPELIINHYLNVAAAKPQARKVTVIYSSMYGAVEKAAKIAARELENRGITSKVYKITDQHQPPISEILSDAIDSQALVVGAATYEGETFPKIRWILELIAAKAASSKRVLVLSSYGWGGVAGTKIAKALGDTGFQVTGKVEFKGAPSPEEEAKIRKAVEDLLK